MGIRSADLFMGVGEGLEFLFCVIIGVSYNRAYHPATDSVKTTGPIGSKSINARHLELIKLLM